MAWNQPGNNGQDNDPWGSNNRKKQTTSNESFFDKLNGMLKKGSSGNNSGGKKPVSLSLVAAAVAVVIVVVWGVSGFYTINQSERGVVTRFGQVQPQIIEPGLNWNPPLIDKVYPVDIKGTRNFIVSGFIVTAGENLVFVEMDVQYKVTNPIKYLFNVTDVDNSLRQAADSALRTVIGSSNMDQILTSGRSELETRTKSELTNIIANYDMGIGIEVLNFQSARPPEEVQEAFNDAIKAREDREREINKANADRVQVVQQAEGRAARILAEADAYKVKIELEAQGDVARFEKLLPEYRAAPEILRERLYIETMERVLSSTNKVIVNDKSGNIMLLPLEQMLKNKAGDVSSNNNSTSLPQINSGSTRLTDSSSSSTNKPATNTTTTRSTNTGNTTRTGR
ncbi:FtsH protease activity modulator HflK [Zophobihabitans entericus]|uniref:Protein HflK n=1 Tax=Zophobihabitans entericus TaxID=1635327 RepID=A0A6G9I9W0_9GAMM|nr:FtsH protease activity modulator HflK [Zophobihabitans entericus]QIQ20514.1 FtsH protease activity modulator HflK [Zophobihabitans entericus]